MPYKNKYKLGDFLTNGVRIYRILCAEPALYNKKTRWHYGLVALKERPVIHRGKTYLYQKFSGKGVEVYYYEDELMRNFTMYQPYIAEKLKFLTK